MKYAQIRKMDIANGKGIRASLFVSGCEFDCKGCFNKEFQDFDYGKEWTEEISDTFIELINRPRITGATILGGEPMHPNNIEEVTELLIKIQMETDKPVWVYTGFKYEYLLKHHLRTLVNIDVLVDGQFIESKKDLKLKFRGSSNQRIIDVQKSLKEDKIVSLHF